MVNQHEAIYKTLDEQKRLLRVFPYPGRDESTTALLEARRTVIRSRIAELEKKLEELRKEDRERTQRWLRSEQERLTKMKELAKAPRCILVERHYDEEGEPLELNMVLARYIGELELNSPLVIYQDYGGSGAWIPQYSYPSFSLDDVPEEIIEQLSEEYKGEYASWKEFVDSCKKVEKVRSYTYFGDTDDLKYGQEVVTKWVTPDGQELAYLPSEPASVESRIEKWWWANVVALKKPQIEAEWRAQAIELLNSFGWEVKVE